jgi:hypothetical protein
VRALAKSRVRSLAVAGLIVLVWEGAKALFAIPTYMLPHIHEILGDFLRRTGSEELLLWIMAQNAYVTALESPIGFLLGGGAGLVLATTFAHSRLLERGVLPYVMTYNEYKQVLDSGVKPDDLVVIDFNKEGTAMLEDGIFVKADYLKPAANKDVAARFVRASLKGWEFCRDKPAECVDIVLKESPVLGRPHQTWMMAEINKLIWGPPRPATALGKMNPAAFKLTANIALKFGVIKKPADPSLYTHEIWELAQTKG